MKASRVNVWVLLGGFLLTIPLVWILASGFGKDPHAIRSVLEGKAAPTFVLYDLNGEPVDLESLKGRPVVVNFWSTWCGPCKYEHPLLQQASRVHREVQFLGVIYSDDSDKVRRYLAKAGGDYPNLEDPGGTVAISYGVTGVPETFFIGRDGTIAHKEAGPVNGPILQTQISEILR